MRARTVSASAGLLAFFATATVALAQPGSVTPENVEVRRVAIWSEGVRLAGDLYTPKELASDARLPAIVLSHGWGGNMVGQPGWARASLPTAT